MAFTLAWIGFEMRHPEPLVDMRMMRQRAGPDDQHHGAARRLRDVRLVHPDPQFVQVPTSAGFGFGATVTAAGLFMLPSALVMLVAGPVSGWMGGRYGSKLPLLIGTILACVAFTSLAIWHDSHLSIYVGTTFMGLGIGFAFAAMANLIVDAVDQSQTGVATGMNTIMRSIGGAIGGQVSASIIAGHVVAGGAPAESGYTLRVRGLRARPRPGGRRRPGDPGQAAGERRHPRPPRISRPRHLSLEARPRDAQSSQAEPCESRDCLSHSESAIRTAEPKTKAAIVIAPTRRGGRPPWTPVSCTAT